MILCNTLMKIERKGMKAVQCRPGEYYYNTATNTLYWRPVRGGRWEISCDGNCNKPDCEVKHSDKYYFHEIGELPSNEPPPSFRR